MLIKIYLISNLDIQPQDLVWKYFIITDIITVICKYLLNYDTDFKDKIILQVYTV